MSFIWLIILKKNFFFLLQYTTFEIKLLNIILSTSLCQFPAHPSSVFLLFHLFQIVFYLIFSFFPGTSQESLFFLHTTLDHAYQRSFLSLNMASPLKSSIFYFPHYIWHPVQSFKFVVFFWFSILPFFISTRPEILIIIFSQK